MKHRKLRALGVGILLVVCGALFFRETVAVHLSPRLVLGKAIPQTLSVLENRFSGNPAHILLDALDRKGKQNIRFQLDTDSRTLGVVHCSMDIRTQGAPAQVASSGSIMTGRKNTELSFFLNDTFAAVSCPSLNNRYYGITYDSFSRDLREHPMLALLAGDDTLEKWESSIAALQKAFSYRYELPDFSVSHIQTVLLGILALKPQVFTDEISISGAQQKVQAVVFRISGPDVAALSEDYRDYIPDSMGQVLSALRDYPDSALQIRYDLLKGQIIRFTADFVCNQQQYLFSLDLGTSPQEESITLSLFSPQKQWQIGIDTHSREEDYRENIRIESFCGNTQSESALDYVWNSTTGELKLTVRDPNEARNLCLNLREQPEGFTLYTEDFQSLMYLITGQAWPESGICTITVSKGTVFPAPEYLDFSQWSMEDTLSLLGSLGALIGLPIS